MSSTGRNDACPCGSGKKYKACCLPQDEAQRAATRSLRAAHEAAASRVLDALSGALDWAVENRAEPIRAAVSAGFFSIIEDPGGLSEFLDTLEDEAEVEWLLFMAHEWALAEGPSEFGDEGPVDSFLRDEIAGENGPPLEADDRKVVASLTAAPLTLAMIERIDAERIVLTDLLEEGRTFEVVNLLEEIDLEPELVLGVRAFELEGVGLVPSPCLVVFDPADGVELAERLTEAIAEDPEQERILRATWIVAGWLEATYGLEPADDEDEDDEDYDDSDVDEDEGAAPA